MVPTEGYVNAAMYGHLWLLLLPILRLGSGDHYLRHARGERRSGPIDSAYSVAKLASPVGNTDALWAGKDSAGEWFGGEFVPPRPGESTLATQPVAWNNGLLTQFAGNWLGAVSGVNAAGQAVGSLYGNFSSPQLPDVNNQAFLYDNGTLTNLGTFGYQQSGATAISADGQIALWVRNGSGQSTSQQVIIDNNGKLTAVPAAVPNAIMSALAINNAGQVLGTFESPNGQHAFLYSGGKTIDIGALQNQPQPVDSPSALSSTGIVVGLSSTDNTWHSALCAYMYHNGVTSSIPLYNGNEFLPTSVNAQGQVLGSIAVGNNISLGLLYNSATGSMVTLNSLIPSNTQFGNLIGTNIDDQGDIIAYSNVNGQFQYFELTPNGPGSEAPVPEPSTWIIFIALSGTGILKKRFSRVRANDQMS